MVDSASQDEENSDSWSLRGLPRRLGRYELIAEIGAGGMASVFLARTTGPGRFHKWVAVKQVHPHLARDRKFLAMFLDEARVAAAIQHPNVAQVFDLGDENDEYYLAMEYLEGEHLGAVASRMFGKKQRFPAPLAARIVAAAAAGLHHAHEARDENGEPLELVHRDVSPHNIFVTYGGDVKVMDFGVAKAAGRITTTETGGRKGKLAYMSPEQLLNEGLDRRTDVFALGIILWEITLARRLFRAENDAQTISRILNGQFKKPTELEPGYPLELETIVLKALARDPENRYSTAQELQIDLEGFAAKFSTVAGSLGVAGVMRDLFPDRIEQKRTLLRGAATTVPSSPGSVAASTGGHRAVAVRVEDEAKTITGSGVDHPGAPREAPEFSQVSPSQASREFRQLESRARTNRAPLVLGGAVLVAVGVVVTLAIQSQFAAPREDATARGTTTGESVTVAATGVAATGAAATTTPSGAGTPTPDVAATDSPAAATGTPTAPAGATDVAAITPEPTAPPATPTEAARPTPRDPSHRRERPESGRTETHTEAAPARTETPRTPEPAPAATGETTRILVVTRPWSHVRINGRAVGTTPYNGAVPLGAVTIEMTPEGGEARTVRRTAASGERVSVNCDLTGPCS